jgi:Aminomethyltransferase folate-binding domain
VGLVERAELRLLEARGAQAVLSAALESAIPGGVPGSGEARCVADTWCCRVDAERALVAGETGAVDRWRQVVSRAASTTGMAVTAQLLPEGEAVSMVGPKASLVLTKSSLPGDLEPGRVESATIAGVPVSVVCEDETHYLLLFPEGCPPEALEAIGAAGQPLGLARVGHDALAHLRAARRGHD